MLLEHACSSSGEEVIPTCRVSAMILAAADYPPRSKAHKIEVGVFRKCAKAEVRSLQSMKCYSKTDSHDQFLRANDQVAAFCGSLYLLCQPSRKCYYTVLLSAMWAYLVSSGRFSLITTLDTCCENPYVMRQALRIVHTKPKRLCVHAKSYASRVFISFRHSFLPPWFI